MQKIIRGDFQTPQELANKVVKTVKRIINFSPDLVLEPSCGLGHFLKSSISLFENTKNFIGIEINREYAKSAETLLKNNINFSKVKLITGDFFEPKLLDNFVIPNNTLIIGNPPWVTNSAMGELGGANLPDKINFKKLNGLDAITGKSNFDISEWMIYKYIELLKHPKGLIAVLCKTSVARKVLLNLWKNNSFKFSSQIYQINAMEEFGVSVDACLLIILKQEAESFQCKIFETLDSINSFKTISYNSGILSNNFDNKKIIPQIFRANKDYVWRSGIKHDCSKVMELIFDGESLKNGYGEIVEIESRYCFPLIKSSDLANDRVHKIRKMVIVTQVKPNEDTKQIMYNAPQTWGYLNKYKNQLNARKSSIYKGKSEFSIFGVGDYTFTEWKIAISSMYKRLDFKLIGKLSGQTAVFDDTVNFIPCYSKDEAEFIITLLNSEITSDCLLSRIFWDNKRPITIEILNSINLYEISKILGKEAEYNFHIKKRLHNNSINLELELF